MPTKASPFLTATVFVVAAASLNTANGQSRRSEQPQVAKAAGGANKDEEAIRNSARDFTAAFERRDAQAIAALWTERGELEDDTGRMLRGREAIEKSYAEFFRQQPGGKIEVLIRSIRFPAPDVALEEGILRQSSAGKELPSTTRYSAVHARDAGQWKIAQCQEWGVGQDHLDDLNWLVGTWKGKAKDADMTLTLAWHEKEPVLAGKYSKTVGGKPSSGTLKIGFDPQRGRLRSWHTDDDGGRGNALWRRDGNRWLMDSTGVTADGKQTAAVNILARVDNDNFTWRSIDRLLGSQPAPDTAPIKLSRAAAGK